ncbi:MAG: FAD-dependent oxidoreductase [Chloroflexi bacterium]|nr:FAD-dependent oxidoreductase [Chloroflexota bacterium]
MKYDYDVVIVGVGSAGMVAAEVAFNMGVRAAMVERDRVGGDCLWTGCVPSKTLLSSAKAAHTIRNAAAYGIDAGDLKIDTTKVWDRIKRVQEEIASTDDNADRFREMGVDVLEGEATFVAPHRISVGDREVSTKYALVCTGSRPVTPPIDGLEETGFLNSENLFQLAGAPESLIVLGGGPIGVEMAQGMNRLGVKTVLLEATDGILTRDEPSLTAILMDKLRSEGVEVCVNAKISRVERQGDRKVVSGQVNGEERRWEASEMLVAAGRKPNIDALDLDAVGVKTGRKGIRVDERLRTSADWVYAAGDCAGRFLFTHSAAAEAAMALRNMFYPGGSAAPTLVPWATFTDPELAHVGMTVEEAERKLGKKSVRVFEFDLAHSDRARTEGATSGKMLLVTDNRLKILGAHILAPSAGEMISQFTLAIVEKVRLTPGMATTNLMQVYPTYSTAVTQLAGDAIYEQLRSPVIRAARRLNRLLFE